MPAVWCCVVCSQSHAKEQRPLLVGYSGDNHSAPVHMMCEFGQITLEADRLKLDVQ